MKLRDATPDERDLVLSKTHALWSDGLELVSYQEYVTTLLHSDWGGGGKENYRFLVLADSDLGVAGALKLYRFRARLAGKEVFLGGLGAVFTPPALRRRGHAAVMLSQAHEIMRERGDAASLLFSEIGPSYYARHGYRPLPIFPFRIDVPEQARASDAVCRMRKPELDTVMRIRESEDSGAGFALLRDRHYWGYLLARASCPTLWLGRDRWESRLMLAGSEGYLWSMMGAEHGGSRARILEFGETSPGAALSSLLDEFFLECRARGITQAEAWIPPELAGRDERLPGANAAKLVPPPVVPMWLPLQADFAQEPRAIEASVRLHLTDLF